MSPEVHKVLMTLNTDAHREFVLTASDEHLDEYILNISGNENLHRLGLAERSKRQFKHLSAPHWSVTPNFWISLIACLAAIVAAYFAWRADFREQQRDHTVPASGSPAAPASSPLPSSPSNSPALKP